MDRKKFIQASSMVRVLEKKLISKQTFDRLVEASDLEESLRYLSDTIYQNHISKIKSPSDYEEVLFEEIKRFYKEIYSISPSTIPIELVTSRYFYHNLKVLLKEAIQKEDFSDIYVLVEDYDYNKLKEVADNDSLKSSDEYFDIIKKAKELYENSKDPQVIDIYIDSVYFEKLVKIAKETKVQLFEQYVEDLIDFTNIRTLLRVQNQQKDLDFLRSVIVDGGSIEKKKYFDYLNTKIDQNSSLFKSARIYKYVKRGIADFESSQNLSTFEKEMDNYFMSLAEESKKITYGPEVVFSYVLAKETEIKNLRIIFVSKLNGLNNEFIKERLREAYV